MNKSTSLLLLIFIIVLTLPIFFITIPVIIIFYNKLVRKRNQVQYAFSGVDVALQKRGELIPNLVDSVKKYMSHEQNTLNKIVELRNEVFKTSSNSSERFEMENKLSGLLSSLMINVENYPDLKSNENMLQLQRSLNETEEQISASRRAYNASVININNAIQTLPSNILANAFSFKLHHYFKAEESLIVTPKIKQLFD